MSRHGDSWTGGVDAFSFKKKISIYDLLWGYDYTIITDKLIYINVGLWRDTCLLRASVRAAMLTFNTRHYWRHRKRNVRGCDGMIVGGPGSLESGHNETH